MEYAMCIIKGRPSPRGNDAFTTCFRFPLIFENNFQNFNFPQKFVDFHSPKFMMTSFFSHWLKILDFPLFSLFRYLSLYFGKIITYFPIISLTLRVYYAL